MDKNAIKKYAVWARNELIARVTQKAEQYEITEKKITPADVDSIGGRLLTDAEKKQRKALIDKIQADGFEQVMEEVAYTWFNRFTALRFMEVNNYLPSHTRVFTNEAGEFKPQILADAIQLDLEGLDMDKVFELKDANRTEELYKYLLITQCNALSAVLPRMFQKIEHYTELLLPDYLLREGSVIEQMITLIPEGDWTDQVQIIGWLYQYYNSEPKDAVFAALKKNVKISKENIPAATQLFTPDWIVRYMVENSLGRLWLEGHPNDVLKSEWEYYLDAAEQEEDVRKQLNTICKEYAALKPEEIRCIDPCMGSGHILCYMFDVLVKIYEDYGYMAREAVENIVEKNLWGLDIDERAAQLSYFAVMMKARQYDRRFFTRNIQPHVYAIEDSDGITSAPMHDMGIDLSQEEYGRASKQAMRLVEEIKDAKEYGSLIQVTPCDWDLLRRFAVARGVSRGQMMLDIHGEIAAAEKLQTLINIGEALSQKYNIVVTNPPYMGASGMNKDVTKYAKKYYPDSKSDMFAMFMERARIATKENGFFSLITQHSWMFLVSYEKLRESLKTANLVNLSHLGAHAFEEIGGEVVQTCSFVYRNKTINNAASIYVRLLSYAGENEKKEAFLKGNNVYSEKVKSFDVIPGAPFAYWLKEEEIAAFNNPKIGDKHKARQGMSTTDNERFVRKWYEIPFGEISFDGDTSSSEWFLYNKSGEYRRWYGNLYHIVHYEKGGDVLIEMVRKKYPNISDPEFIIKNRKFYFKEAVTWSMVSTSNYAARYVPSGAIFDISSPSIFDAEKIYYLLGLVNSKFSNELLNVINPTMNYNVGDVENLPYVLMPADKEARVVELVKENIKIAKEDWDSKEVSWGFKQHPFIGRYKLLSDAFMEWKNLCDSRISRMKRNEEELNSLFAEAFGVSSCIDNAIELDNITLYRADEGSDIRSFISYAVGCMFGRYSIENPGLMDSNIELDKTKFGKFSPDIDAIIPICDDEYFEDDIVGRFIDYVATLYGTDTLEDNLKFIADSLGGKGTSRDIIRNYFLSGFYSDHVKTYQRRPIYWLFDSGKENGFKCLVYIHRYKPDTIARIRTDYVHEQQSRYRTAISDIEQRMSGLSTSDRVKLNKELTNLKAQAEEIRLYEEKIHHLADRMISLDLHEGVKKNYDQLKEVLSKL